MPVLAEGAATASGQRAADLQAHMGWADYLRNREGAGGADPKAHYQKALAVESSNVYAHAMWGHYLLLRNESFDEARQHFVAALASGRERGFVRNLQLAAMLNDRTSASQIELARIAGEMRKNGETIDDRLRDRLWSYAYYAGLLSGERRERFMSGLREAEHVATFQWLFPENQVRQDRREQWRFFLASLEQAAGERAAALARYEALHADFQRQRASGPMLDATVAAIKLLRGP
jgi:hypothetical protein